MVNQLQAAICEASGLEVGLEARLRNYGVKRRRLAKGLTQKQLGELVGVSGGAIGHIEAFRKRPSDGLCLSLAEALECDAQSIWPDWLDALMVSEVTSVAIVGQQGFEQLTSAIEKTLVSQIESSPFASTDAKEVLEKALKDLELSRA